MGLGRSRKRVEHSKFKSTPTQCKIRWDTLYFLKKQNPACPFIQVECRDSEALFNFRGNKIFPQNAITAAGHFTSLLVETLISVVFAVTMYCALQDESWGVWARVFGFLGRWSSMPVCLTSYGPVAKLLPVLQRVALPQTESFV